MLLYCIKYGTIILCCTYSFCKIFQTRSTLLLQKAVLLSFLLGETIIVAILRVHGMMIAPLFMLGLSVFIHRVIYQLGLGTSLTGTIIGFGITYVSNSISVLACVVYKLILNDHSEQSGVIEFTIISVTQILVIALLFRIKRLRCGIPYLSDPRYTDVSLHLGVFILNVVILELSTKDRTSIQITFPMLTACAALLIFAWRSRISREYIERLYKREYIEQQKTIDALTAQRDALQAENEKFSAIIHKDNKLLPAMELAVTNALVHTATCDDAQERLAQTEQLLAQLHELSNERAGVIGNYERSTQSSPNTGIIVIDAMLAYMERRAVAAGVAFTVTLDVPLQQIVPTHISAEDLSTLMADLLENAILAARDISGGAVAVRTSAQGPCYRLCIYDNGAPFPAEVLQNQGMRRITTRAASGGSGIGLMTAHEICARNHITFAIEPCTDPYTKAVTLTFHETA